MSYTALRTKLAESLATAYQLPEGDIANILPENEEEFKEEAFKERFLELDKERIASINLRGKEKFEQGYAKAKKEVLKGFEDEVKDEFGIEDNELIGIDLVKKVVEKNTESAKGDITKLSEDEVKKHPSVINLLNEREKTFKQEKQEIEESFNSKLQKLNKDQVFNTVSKKALNILDSLNPVLSTDPNKATNQKNILLRDLENFEYQKSGDDFIPLDKDGKRLEDGHGNGITVDQLVKSTAERYFDFKQADPRSTPPAGGNPGAGGSGTTPKTESEYAKVLTDPSIPFEEKQRIKEEWNKAMS